MEKDSTVRRVIATSLYGGQEKYRLGLIENLSLAGQFYSDWDFWVYVDDANLDWVADNLETNSELRLIPIPHSEGFAGSAWRFMAAFDCDVDVVVFRDLDSRFNEREAVAVRAWIRSGRKLHIMRDHPFHSWKILAGMFGLQNLTRGEKEDLRRCFESWDFSRFGSDQTFLAKNVYPLFGSTALVHDSFFRREPHRLPFPAERKQGEFVGESFGSEGPDHIGREICRRYESSDLLRFKLLVRDSIRIR